MCETVKPWKKQNFKILINPCSLRNGTRYTLINLKKYDKSTCSCSNYAHTQNTVRSLMTGNDEQQLINYASLLFPGQKFLAKAERVQWKKEREREREGGEKSADERERYYPRNHRDTVLGTPNDYCTVLHSRRIPAVSSSCWSDAPDSRCVGEESREWCWKIK